MLYSYDKDTDQFIPAGDLGGGGLVGLKGTATATGDWTITGLVPGKPLFITYKSLADTSAFVKFGITAGVVNSSTTDDGFLLGYMSSTGDNSGNVAIFIPTVTDLVIAVHDLSSVELYAYQ